MTVQPLIVLCGVAGVYTLVYNDQSTHSTDTKATSFARVRNVWGIKRVFLYLDLIFVSLCYILRRESSGHTFATNAQMYEEFSAFL